MIIEWLVETVAAIVMGLLDYLPATDFDMNQVVEGVRSFAAMASALNNYLPLYAIFAGIAILLAIKYHTTTFNFSVWVYHQFWGSGN